MTVKAPHILQEVPGKILEAYRAIGLDTSDQFSVLLPILWKECQKPNVIRLRSIGQVMESNDFSSWFFKAVLFKKPDGLFKHWIEPINDILATVQPKYDERGNDDSTHRVTYAVLLFFLSPLFSLSELIRLKGGWHLLCDGSSFYDLNIHQYMPRTENEREELLKLMDEIEEPCVRRMIIYYLGLSPIESENGPHQRKEIFYGRGDVWAQKAQSEMYKCYPHLFENIDFKYEHENQDLVKKMIAHIVDVKQLTAMAKSDDPILAQCAIDRWNKAIRNNDLSPDWRAAYDIARKNPELFSKVNRADLEIIALQWSSNNKQAKEQAIENIFDYISMESMPYDNGMYSDSLPENNNYCEQGIELLKSMVQDDHDSFMELVRSYHIPSPRVPWLLFSKRVESLFGLMWDYVIEGHSSSTNFTDFPVLTHAVINLMITDHPEKIAELEAGVMGSLLSNSSATTLSSLSHSLLPVVIQYDSAARGLIDAISQLDSQKVKELSWLFTADENIRSILIKALIKLDSEKNFSLLEKIYREENTSQIDRELCLDYLESQNNNTQQFEVGEAPKTHNPQEQVFSDYGMKNGGWGINAGTVKYRVILYGDHSLRVVSESGRMTKSLPKPRHDSDQDDFNMARLAFNELKKIINKEVKSTRKNLYTHLVSATRWCSDQWKKSYLSHPLQKRLTGGIIWSRLSADGDFFESFRVNDDKLTNSRGQAVIFAADNSVRLWHPIDDSVTIREQWRQDAAQSESTPIIIQTDLPVVNMPEKQRNRLVSYQYQGYAMTIFDFKKFISLFHFVPWGGDKGYNSNFDFRIVGGSGQLAISLKSPIGDP